MGETWGFIRCIHVRNLPVVQFGNATKMSHSGIHLRAMSDTLVVNEIYLSLQGESTFAGLPCVFVRLTACNLRCSYCDTAYAFTEGKKRELAEVRAEVLRLAKPYFSDQPSTINHQLPL